jgi:hypothetical protein
MTKLASGERTAEDSAGAAYFGIEDFFDLGRGALSRFSNHDDQSKAILYPRRHASELTDCKCREKGSGDDNACERDF